MFDDDDPQFEFVQDDNRCKDCRHYHDPDRPCPKLDERGSCGQYPCCH